MSLADRYTARQNADGTWTVRVTRRYATAMGLGYRDETRTYVAAHRPATPGDAWLEGERIAHETERRWGRRAMRKRGKMIAGLLSLPCTLCDAVAGAGCDYDLLPAREFIRLDRDPLLIVHTERMMAAISSGAASRSAVLAQFGDGPLPAALKSRP